MGRSGQGNNFGGVGAEGETRKAWGGFPGPGAAMSLEEGSEEVLLSICVGPPSVFWRRYHQGWYAPVSVAGQFPRMGASTETARAHAAMAVTHALCGQAHHASAAGRSQ